MSLFDTFAQPAPRPVCCECGGGMGRGGEEPGALAKSHDRCDRAVQVGVDNPCPGAGRPTIAASDYIDANERMRREWRRAQGGESRSAS